MNPDDRLNELFIELANTLVTDYDPTDVCDRLVDACVDRLGAAAAGIMVADERGRLRTVAASDQRASLLELLQQQLDEGPCLACYHGGLPISDSDLADGDARWPTFAATATNAGFRAAYARPLRLRGWTFGGLNIFMAHPGGLTTEDAGTAQAIADFATLAVAQPQAHRPRALADRLRRVLTDKAAIEHAKGMLAATAGIDITEAHDRLRDYARTQDRHRAEVARDLVGRALDPAVVTASAGPARG